MAKTETTMSPVNPGAKAKEVLVIKLSALGDFVLALGAMKAVRETHPSARITLLAVSLSRVVRCRLISSCESLSARFCPL